MSEVKLLPTIVSDFSLKISYMPSDIIKTKVKLKQSKYCNYDTKSVLLKEILRN